MNQDLKKYLKVGGILCAIGAVSAILITCTNLLTAPKIAANEAEKKAAGFRSVYEDTKAVGDDVAVSGHYVSFLTSAIATRAKQRSSAPSIPRPVPISTSRG
jgi:Na+-translocating ferredoxin:NAD+ oxidoreductase RnfG subunit